MNINQHKGFEMLKKEYRHSASSANAFIDSPAYWVITKLYNFEGPVNSRMVMGTAAEHGANEALSNINLKPEEVMQKAEDKYLKEGGDPHNSDMEKARNISMRFVTNLSEFGDLVSYQNEKMTDGKKYGLKYPIKTVTDFEFEEVIVDTKATAYLKRLKKGILDPNWYPKSSDVRQQMLYAEVYKKPTMLLYSSEIDTEAVDMVDRPKHHLDDIINAMKTIEHISSIAKTKEDIIRMYPLNMDNFRWGKENDSPYKEFARKLWTKAYDYNIK
tara:strand:+ start:1418 stop:2233 length:816 start_codon:yes stop_codon:yes gene_type:complete